MSTRVLIKMSTCVWICKVLGLRSNHSFCFFVVFFPPSLRPLLNHRQFTTPCICKPEPAVGGSVLSRFLALEFPSNSVCSGFSLKIDIWIRKLQSSFKTKRQQKTRRQSSVFVALVSWTVFKSVIERQIIHYLHICVCLGSHLDVTEVRIPILRYSSWIIFCMLVWEILNLIQFSSAARFSNI